MSEALSGVTERPMIIPMATTGALSSATTTGFGISSKAPWHRLRAHTKGQKGYGTSASARRCTKRFNSSIARVC